MTQGILFYFTNFGIHPTMMTPISDPRPDTAEEHYQGLHLTARSIVERCIGVLKARFRNDYAMDYIPYHKPYLIIYYK